MDKELDLLDRGPGRGDIPLEPVQVARYGEVVTGVVAYDQVFGRRANPGPPPVPLETLFSRQAEVYASVLAGALKARGPPAPVEGPPQQGCPGFGVCALEPPLPV